MRLRRGFIFNLILFAVLLQPCVRAQQSAADAERQAAAQLAGSVLVGGRAFDYVKELTDKFGGRLSGSSAYERSAEWAAAQFRAMGIKDVKLEPFELDNGWERGGRARGRIVAPVERTLHVESLAWSPSTPPGGVRGEVVVVGDVSEQAIRAKASELKGRVALLDMQTIFAAGVWQALGRVIAADKFFKEAGALAVVFPDGEANNVLNAFSLNWGAKLNALPYAQVGMEDATLISRFLKEQPGRPVTIEFQYENRTAGRTRTHNVVAEIRGRERPEEWVIVGAHLDSWDYGTGAQDNGTGVAMVLEAARAISAAGRQPRRSIRFALWGGEEQGLLGSAAYVRDHAGELKNCVAALNTDNGAGRPFGWKVQGREDVSAAMKPISEALLQNLGGRLSPKLTFNTDHGHFMLAGIPALDLWVDTEPYDKVHHKPSDTLDKINEHDLATGAAVVAVTAYTVAERAAPLAPHIDRQAVGELLKKEQLADFLRSVGVWQ